MTFLIGYNILLLTRNCFNRFVNQVRNSRAKKSESVSTVFCIISENMYVVECNRASYFCESDIRNNFTIRRQPSFFCEAVANCTIENSFLTSSKSVSEIHYAKNGLTGGLDHLRVQSSHENFPRILSRRLAETVFW